MSGRRPERAPASSLGAEPLARRSLSSDRRRAAWLLGTFVAVAAVSAWFFFRHGAESGVGPSTFHYTLLTTNLLLLFALIVSVARYSIRLLSERRAGLLGSRFRLKLVATFIGLCLLPAVVLYIVAIAILFAAVNRTLGPEVDAIVEDAQAQVTQFLEDAETDVARELRDLSAGLARGVLVTPEHREELRQRLERELASRGLAAARLHFRGRAEVLELHSPVLAARGLRSPLAASEIQAGEFESDLSTVLSGEPWPPQRLPREGELYLVAGAAIRPTGHAQPAAALFVARAVPAEIRDGVTRLNELRQQHHRLRAQAPWLKAEQALLFMGFSLFTILGATWVGLYIARSITVPIERLAEGTAAIRRGELSHVVHWQGNDELAVLVEGFNEMARDLRAKADEVEGKTRELEAANVELGRRRDEMAQLVETMTAGVIVLAAGGGLVSANRAARQLLGAGAGARPGASVAELLPGQAFAPLRRAIRAALAPPGTRRALNLVIPGEQGPLHLQAVLTEQPAAGDDGPGLLVLLEDVTELVRAQKLETWREVARRIAHEIKNPLTPIQLSAQRILKKYREGSSDLAEVLESGVRTIVDEVGGLKQMVNEFSQFARLPDLEPVAGDVNRLLASVARLYEAHEGLDLRVEPAPELPAVRFDPELLRRAVVNLVENAVEATGGKGPVLLSSEAGPGGRGLRVSVRDGGRGIPRSDRGKLFLPYFTTKPEGTGLGLAIVDRIVTGHGGRVSIGEGLGEGGSGAGFVIELPPAPREPGPAEAPPSDAAPESAQLSAGPGSAS